MGMPKVNMNDDAIKQIVSASSQQQVIPAIAKEIVGSKDVNGSAPRKIDANKVLITHMANRLPEEFETDEFKQFMVAIEATNGNEVPINVYKLESPGPNGEEYGLVYGHRRTIACQRTKCPLTVIVVPKPDPRAHIKAMVMENDHRDNVALYGKALWIAANADYFDSIYQASVELRIPDTTLRRYKRIAEIPSAVINLFTSRLDITAVGADKVAQFMAKNPEQFRKNFENVSALGTKLPFMEAVKLLTADEAKAAPVSRDSSTSYKDGSGNDFAQMKVTRQQQLRITLEKVTDAERKKFDEFLKRLRA